MAYKLQATFSTGELDPVLSERMTLAKFKASAKTARNVVVGRAGNVITRPSRKTMWQTKTDDKAVKIYAVPKTTISLEIGFNYIRKYDSTTLISETPLAGFTDDDLLPMNFETSGDFVYIFVPGKPMTKLNWSTGFLVASPFLTPVAGTNLTSVASGAPSGYFVDYAFTYVVNGEESAPFFLFGGATIKVPIANGQAQVLTATVAFGALLSSVPAIVTETRTYRRAVGGGVHGFIGSTNNIFSSFNFQASLAPTSGVFKIAFSQGTTANINFNASAATIQIAVQAVPGLSGALVTGTVSNLTIVLPFLETTAVPTIIANTLLNGGVTPVTFAILNAMQSQFTDLGGAADYTHQIPTPSTYPQHPTVTDLNPPTGIVYQQRLILADFIRKEPIWASRPGFQNNFNRDYPINSDSALNFKSASSGTAKVLWFCDSYGLVVFTTQGVFVNSGTLSPTTLGLDKKGRWVADSFLKPLAVPGGVLFVDRATNSVRSLNWSTEQGGYTAEDVGIYSGHLFRKNKIISWAFQEGAIPLLFVTFEDGTFGTFTYEFEQDMKAWTRHDSNLDSGLVIEQVAETGNPENTMFLVRKGTTRYVEMTIPRYVPAIYFMTDPQAAMNPTVAKMDSMFSYNGGFSGEYELRPQTAGDWEGPLVLTCGNAGQFVIGTFPVGTILRKFNNDDQTSIDLEIISRTDDNTLVVQPNIEYPEDEQDFELIYRCITTITGLTWLEGEYVGLVVDGRIISSPLNDIDNYPDTIVDAGSITFPQNVHGAIVHVGRVFAADLETNDIDTIEEKPVYIESKSINKVYVKTKDSNGLFVGSKFPADDKLAGLAEIDQYDVDYSSETPIVGNRAKPTETKRFEIPLPGDWNSNGRVCIRNVDPLHSEILSIIPDAEVLWRGDQ